MTPQLRICAAHSCHNHADTIVATPTHGDLALCEDCATRVEGPRRAIA